MRKFLCMMAALVAGILLVPALAASEPYADLPGASFRSVLPVAQDDYVATVSDYRLMTHPVTNGEFLRFVVMNPEWRRSVVKTLFADSNYLEHWQGPLSLGQHARSNQPVTNVSWFAARAYCEAQGAQLPTWHEWEFAAAADEHEPDARANPEWRQEILAWYEQTGGKNVANVMQSPANYYGVYDLHGLVWEWVENYNALLVSSDNRVQGGADKLQFCGAGALTMRQKENYAILMRIAMLSSLKGRDTTRNMGFRCAQ